MIKMDALTEDELKYLIANAERELKKRKDTRRNELIQTVCDAMNKLHKEFPAVELRVGYQCPECALDEDVDVIRYFCNDNQMNPKDFYIY